MIVADYPKFAKNRGKGFWANTHNLWVARQKVLRADTSNAWRDWIHSQNPVPPDHSEPVEKLVGTPKPSYRFIILGDTGEGDKSQYGLLR